MSRHFFHVTKYYGQLAGVSGCGQRGRGVILAPTRRTQQTRCRSIRIMHHGELAVSAARGGLECQSECLESVSYLPFSEPCVPVCHWAGKGDNRP